MPAPRHATQRSAPTRRTTGVVLAAVMVLGAAVVAAVMVRSLGQPAPAAASPTPSGPAASQPTHRPPQASHPGQPHRRHHHHRGSVVAAPARVVVAHVRIHAHQGRASIRTRLVAVGDAPVRVSPRRAARVPGFTTVTVERVSGAVIHPFARPVRLRAHGVLVLNATYRWHRCPAHVPTVWPRAFAVQRRTHLHWRVDQPKNLRRMLCG